jgi:geranylgeranylglycerol-phosphate geranylgeranyltransferase
MAALAVFLGYSLSIGSLQITAPVLLAMVSAFLICGGGQAVNDYYDREIDARIKPHRPVPSGRVGAVEALMFSMFLFAVGVALSFLINHAALAIASLTAFLLFVYSASLARLKFLGNFLVAGGTALTFIYGASISDNYALASFLFTNSFFANLAREWSKDLEDLHGDIGRKTTLPMIIGQNTTALAAIVALAVAVIAAFLPFTNGLLHKQTTLALLAVSGALFAWMAFRLVKKDYAGASKWAKYAMLVALAAYVAELV